MRKRKCMPVLFLSMCWMAIILLPVDLVLASSAFAQQCEHLYGGIEGERFQLLVDWETGTHRVGGNEVEICPEAVPDYELRTQLIDQADVFVFVYTLLIQNDETGLETVAQLISKSVFDDVEVDVILHPISQTSSSSAAIPAAMRTLGVNVRDWWALNATNVIEFLLLGPHKKLLLVDSLEFGLEAVVGGRNIGDNYFGTIPDQEPDELSDIWRDTDIHVRGPILYELADDFIRRFNEHSHGLPTIDECSNWPIEPCPYKPDVSVADPYADVDFIPTKDLLEGIYEALERGVLVVLLTNSQSANDMGSPLFYASAYYWPDLIDAGAEIYMWDFPRPPGHEEIFRTMHSKLIIVDRCLFMPGSWNFDGRAIIWSSEYAFPITDESLAAEAHVMYENDLEENGVIPVDLQWFEENWDGLDYFLAWFFHLFSNFL